MERPPRSPAAVAVLAVLGCLAPLSGCAGEPVSFDTPPAPTGAGAPAVPGPAARPSAAADAGPVAGTLMPTGPRAEFTTENTVDDGTKIGVTTLAGRKSGFTGRVWVWAPPQYFEPRYAKSGFPVLIALPGGNGYPKNYWMGTDLKLQSSISRWSKEGRSLPFIVVMPVLNPDAEHYHDGSDIPGHEKMGTWMTEDVPDFVRANFRTFTSRDGWAFMGSSSGAFVGLKSVLKHPDKFKAVIASGPDTVPDSPLWAGHEAEKAANDPEKLARALSARPSSPERDVYLAFQIGTEESGLGNLRSFIRDYGKGPVKTRLEVVRGGGHNARTYVRGMGDGSIRWISEHMLAPVPSP
ncbi:esterase family protein [Streptomyces somaliensis]|uniref:alpha/beta hydrolase n=1 Tax=Streptomyces somaliensis TaxID=78355 RepID=UPI0020CBC348|nr:alpha/beta hydrolase-fold protein [Streptomyces somaliensis]MCP9945055.1 esterase family protein [Streptomyces somaliensis]MCP9974544.1 esterase family protein [Streptomyces somaliensis]